MARIKTLTKQFRKPVQARSTYTVEAIFDATVQVLIQFGITQLTTTKVADKAGVSVGTLYQYFPNKNALLSAALERHLNEVVSAIEQACSASKGKTIDIMTTSLINAYFDAKLAARDASMALYAVSSECGGTDLVARMTQRAQLALCDMLATAADVTISDLRVVSYILSTALVGPMQGLLQAAAPQAFVQQVKAQLDLMALAYLRQAGAKRGK